MIGGLLLTAAATACAPISGADSTLVNPTTKFLFVGEQHGTAETPATFADLVCLASAKRPVLVAIEQPTTEQPAIDAYLESNGGAEARARFLQSTIWTNPFKDGRSSQAMFDMIERIRLLKKAGHPVDLIAFEPPIQVQKGENPNDKVNGAMADQLRREADAHPSALIMILTGSVHASRAPIDLGRGAIIPAAARLPKETTVALLADGESGMAWNCQETCGPNRWISRASGTRRVVMTSRPLLPRPGESGAFDGTVYVGAPFTASSPMVATKPQP